MLVEAGRAASPLAGPNSGRRGAHLAHQQAFVATNGGLLWSGRPVILATPLRNVKVGCSRGPRTLVKNPDPRRSGRGRAGARSVPCCVLSFRCSRVLS